VPEPNSAPLPSAASNGITSGPRAPQHFFHFRPLPQGHGSFLPILLIDSILLGRQHHLATVCDRKAGGLRETTSQSVYATRASRDWNERAEPGEVMVPRKLKSRLEALESCLADGSGLVPHSHEWLRYWIDQWRRSCQNPRDTESRMTIEGYRVGGRSPTRALAASCA
jgi:hypothetical protein